MARVVIEKAELEGDLVSVVGTTDGRRHKVVCWKSHLDRLRGKPAQMDYVAGLLKAADDAVTIPPPRIDISGEVIL